MRNLPFSQAALLMSCLALAPSASGADLDLSDEVARINYSVGYQIGGDFKRQGVEMNSDAIVRGIADALAEATPQMGREEMSAALMALKRRIVEDAQAREAEQAARMRRASLAFLERNQLEEGVRVADGGLQYRVIKEGSGASPKAGDRVTVHYEGRLISGQVFDSSRKRGEPATLSLDRVIPGWRQGLRMMREGAIYELYLPPELAYDREGPMADQTLIFNVELLDVASVEDQ
jgi:FKBP-type peptidyl-prolyl cis-trans isomerase FklB